MHHLWKNLGQRLRTLILVMGLIGLLSWAGLAIAPTPAYAAMPKQASAQEEIITPVVGEVENREEAYEQAVEVASDPRGVQKEYKKELNQVESQSEEGGLVGAAVETAKELAGKALGAN